MSGTIDGVRADRLVATLLLMQARGRVTAAQVAQELEVSVATARRDLEALSAAGVPVYPQAGRGGGWSLIGGARTDLSGLTEAEARALFLLVGPAAGADPGLKSALRKLVRALPETFRAQAQNASTAMAIDPGRWGEARATRPALVARISAAIVRRRQVRLTYRGRTGSQTQRTVDPWGLVDKSGVWYLLAGTPNGERTFRVDRIAGLEETDLPGSPPEGFDLDAAWRAVVDEIEDVRGRVHATVVIGSRHLPVLRDHFGRQLTMLRPADKNGQVTVRVSAHLARGLAEKLAGWGNLIDVLEPQVVRYELARIGAELMARYGEAEARFRGSPEV